MLRELIVAELLDHALDAPLFRPLCLGAGEEVRRLDFEAVDVHALP